MNRIIRCCVSLLFKYLALCSVVFGAALCSLNAQATDWPQEITAKEGTIVIYQPQPERLDGNVLSARAAMSLELTGKKDLIFGAFWFSAKLDTDTDDDIARIRDLRVTRVRWPDVTDAQADRFTKIVEAVVSTTDYEISMTRLSTSLASAAQEQKSLAELKNDPPKIVFSEQLAVLLLYDGEPRFSPVENSNYERVLNTPYAVARHNKTRLVYLSSGNWFYEAKDPLGPWQAITALPTDLVALLPPRDKSSGQEKVTAPAIVVATEPTELVVSNGKPEWVSLTGGELLYVKNTETPWLRDVSSDNVYVLLSGRWFRAKNTSGPWTFVRPDMLPASFKNIPPASDIGGLRVSVAGTDEANNAVLDAQIPQTAAIKRKDTTLTVTYDGVPMFQEIPDTVISYAINTAAQVLKIGDRYYAVDNGVWFVADDALGPWRVADKIPEEEIQKIPPSSPMYNVTYVHIYESTPEIVYVGYTTGYMWSFPYYGVPFYGTGWYYPPYWGTIYYPHHHTWGLHVGYNPWMGWHYGMSWSNGFITVGIGWGGGYGHYHPGYCCGGFYGGGYHPHPVHHRGDINIGNSVGGGDRPQVNPNIQNNIYKRAENRVRVADRSASQMPARQAHAASGRENNVYVDRDGNIAQRNGEQWQTRAQGSWQPDQTRSATQGAAPQQKPQQSYDRNEMNRAHQSRQAATSRERSRPAPRGGGRRR